jgi:hypothetical protein
MMQPIRIAYWEAWIFSALSVAGFGYRLLAAGRTGLRGLRGTGVGLREILHEQVLLLAVTLAITAEYLWKLFHAEDGVMPEVGAVWLTVFGLSSALYVLRMGRRS